MTVQEAIDYIESQTWSTTRLGLERTRELLSAIGNPQKSLKFVHVASEVGMGGALDSTNAIDAPEVIAVIRSVCAENDVSLICAERFPVKAVRYDLNG